MKEVPLLRIQARSIARFMSPEMIGEIFIVIHDVEEDECVSRVKSLLNEYGPLESKVRIIRPSRLIRPQMGILPGREQIRMKRHKKKLSGPGWRGTNGWAMQQAFKLLSVGAGKSGYILILDAKNHFLNTIEMSDFVAEDGRPRSSIAQPHEKQLTWISASFEALGQTGPDDLGVVPETVTPFVVERSFLRDAVRFIEGRQGALECFFQRRRGKATEFMLLFAYATIERGGWDQCFAFGLPAINTVFTSTPDEKVCAMLVEAQHQPPKFFGIHRRRVGSLTAKQKALTQKIWVENGLFDSIAETEVVFGSMTDIS